MTSFLVLIGTVLAGFVVAYLYGRKSEVAKTQGKIAEVKDEQIKAALDKPDKRSLVERLRNNDF